MQDPNYFNKKLIKIIGFRAFKQCVQYGKTRTEYTELDFVGNQIVLVCWTLALIVFYL